MTKEGEQTIFSRHTERADGTMGYGLEAGKGVSENYPSITIEGESKAREIANSDFSELIENSPEDAILFIGGSSEEERTKATAEVVGDELAEKYKDSKEVIVFTKDNIDKLIKQAEGKRSVFFEEISKMINENKDKKLVFTFPLYLKEFSLRPHHREKETGEHTDYIFEILKKTGHDEQAATLEWFKNDGKIETEDGRTLEVPSPQQTAETHIAGINRLRKFAGKFAKDRPLSIGMVGHGWQLDALALYLANKGKVDAEAFERIFGGEVIQQPETGTISIDDGKAQFNYRDQYYEVPEDLLK